jgi:hypothetical protein
MLQRPRLRPVTAMDTTPLQSAIDLARNRPEARAALSDVPSSSVLLCSWWHVR